MYFVPQEIYSRAMCLPVLAGEKKTDSVLGGACGTLSVVAYQGVVAIVTAQHVLEDAKYKAFHGKGAQQLYSPLLPDWGNKGIKQYDWRKISHPLDSNGESRLDIAYAILSEAQKNEIAERHVYQLARVTDIAGVFGAVLQGYSGNYNNTARVRRNQSAKPMSCGVEIEMISLAPFVTPTYDNYIYFRYNGEENDVWNDIKHYQKGEKRPALDGLSGGPIFYCENLDAKTRAVPRFSVVGFLLEHSVKTGIAKALISDILIERMLMPHKPRELAVE